MNNNHSLRHRFLLALLLLSLAVATPVLAAVQVTVAGSTAHADIDLAGYKAEFRLDFDGVDNLSAENLGLTATVVDPLDPALLQRLPSAEWTSLPDALPLLITVEPQPGSGFALRNTVHVNLHTHHLPYTAGSRLRLFRAPTGGRFVDITTGVKPGSVHTEGDMEGFSQFLVLLDLRPTSSVIADKLAFLTARLDVLPSPLRAALSSDLGNIEQALAAGRHADALAAVDMFRAAVSARAAKLGNTWTPEARDDNHAGALLATAASLRFSIGYLRDYGE